MFFCSSLKTVAAPSPISLVQAQPCFASPHKVLIQWVSFIEGLVINTDSVITFGWILQYGIPLYFK